MDQCDCSYVVIPMALVNLAGTVVAIVISKYIDRVICDVPESNSEHDESDSEDNLSESCQESHDSDNDSGESGESGESEGSGDNSGESEDDSGESDTEDEDRQSEPEEINKDSSQSLTQENKTSISDEELIASVREGADGFDHGALRGVLVKLTEEGNRLINQPSFVPDGKTEFIMGVVGDIPELFNKLDQNDPGVKAILARKALDVAKILNQNEFDPLSNSVESGSPKFQHESEFLMKTLDSLQ